MHTSTFKIPGYQGDVVVNHNGDWSGEAVIRFQEEVFGDWDVKDKPVVEVEIPAKLLAALALDVTQRIVGDALVGFAEDLPHILRLRAQFPKKQKRKKKGGK